MKFNNIAMILIASFGLMACGGGEDADEPVRYTAIDGYLSNAEVYLDTNQDGIATSDERVGTTDANGQIELEAKSRDYAVIIRIVAGQTVDSDYRGKALRNYEMIAEAGNTVVTPFTTLAHLYDVPPSELLTQLDSSQTLQLTEEMLTGDYVAMAKEGDEAAIGAHILGRSIAVTLKASLAGNYDSDGVATDVLKTQITAVVKAVQEQVKEAQAANDMSSISNMVVVVKVDSDGNIIQQIISSTSDNNTSSKFAINDTGITQCHTNTESDVACRDGDGNLITDVVAGQDGLYGRDSNPKLNTDTDGAAGFNFSKISDTGERLAANAEDWHCVQDNITGLMWEIKTPNGSDDVMGGLRDAAYTYYWYNADGNTNAGDAGVEGAGNCEADDCDTAQYVTAINQAALCTYTDWRLPTREELGSIVDYSASPTIDISYFPNTRSNYYWSSSPVANHVNGAWSVTFDGGYDSAFQKSYRHPVRLVRAGQ